MLKTLRIFFFVGLTVTANLLISAFFSQSTNAKPVELSKTKFATCKVKKNNARFFVSATERFITLKKGTVLSWTIFDMQQGLIVVKAKVGKSWVKGEILMDDTTCR